LGRKADGRWGKIYDQSFSTTQITDPIFAVIKKAGWKRASGFTGRGNKKLLFVIAGGFLILATILFFVFSGMGNIKESARNQIDLLREGKITEVYQGSASSLKRRLSQEEFNAVISEMSMPQIKDYTFNSIAVNNNKARLEGYFVTDEGDKRAIEVGLIKEDDKWKLIFLSLSD